MSDCIMCMKNPLHPDKKCCFNCSRASLDCNVCHICEEDCLGWDNAVKTNADRIRAMSDEELSVFLWEFEREEICRDGEYFITRKKLDEWLKQPAE